MSVVKSDKIRKTILDEVKRFYNAKDLSYEKNKG